MRIIIDRFEACFAVCEKEDKKMINIERKKLPKEAKEGDVIYINDDNIYIDVEETNKRRKEIEKMINDIFD